MKKKKRRFIRILKFLIFELIFCGLTMPALAFYGPFTNVKNTLVGMSMTTMKHRWIAKLFLSDKDINNILSQNVVENKAQSREGLKEIKVKSEETNTIERYDIEGKGFKGYMLIVSNPKKVRVGYAKELGKIGQTTSAMAKRYNAVAAINGGAFTDKTANGSQYGGTGALPLGIIMTDGKVIDTTAKPEEKIDTIGITKEGVLLVGSYTMDKLKELHCKEALSYGPALIVNGEKVKIKGDGGWGTAPRAAIGQRRDGSIILLVIDGTVVKRAGVYMNELQDILYDKGAYTAANLDGGSSTTMYYQGKVINSPCDSVGERCIPSMMYVEP